MDDFDISDFLGNITSGLDEKLGGDTSWLDNFDWSGALENLDFSGLDLSNVIGDVGAGGLFGDDEGAGTIEIVGQRETDPFEIDGLQGSRDESTALIGTETDPYGIDGEQGSRDEFNALTGVEDPYGVDGEQGSRDESTALVGTETDPYGVDGEQGSRDEDTATKGTNTFTNTIKEILKVIADPTGDKSSNAALYALLGGLLGLLNRPSGPAVPVGYQGPMPNISSARGAPGQGTKFTQKAYDGGLMSLAAGGRPARYLRGGTDGMADKIQTDIDGKQPARLSHGEFVIPADVVSHLGNGNSDAGSNVLYDMMAKVRKARTGNSKQGKQINPHKYTPV